MPKPIRDIRTRLYDPRHDAFLRYEAKRRNVAESIVIRDALEVACQHWERVEQRKQAVRIAEATDRARIMERTTMAAGRIVREGINPAVAGALQPAKLKSLDTPAEIRELLQPADESAAAALLPAHDDGAAGPG